jgi:excisionase family DNA binding protein
MPGDAGVRHAKSRGRYFTLQQAADEYPAFTLRLLRRLVQERRIAFSRVGRCIVLAEADIEAYLEANRVEPPPRTCRMAS